MRCDDQRPQISAFMTITGFDWDAEECADGIGIEPFQILRQPAAMVRGKRWVKFMVGFRRRHFDDTHDALLELMGMIWERREAIRSFVSAHDLELSFACNITIWKDRPLYRLGPEALEKLAWFEKDLVLDIFDYSEGSEEKSKED